MGPCIRPTSPCRLQRVLPDALGVVAAKTPVAAAGPHPRVGRLVGAGARADGGRDDGAGLHAAARGRLLADAASSGAPPGGAQASRAALTAHLPSTGVGLGTGLRIRSGRLSKSRATRKLGNGRDPE